MNNSLVFEALCGSADDAVLAARAGATRIELSSSPAAGGLTPTPGSVKLAKERGRIPVMAMLRPRAAGFSYSAIEFETMIEDGKRLVDAGADGLVFGLLSDEGRVDMRRSARLMREVPCREWVFHRAFDLAPEPFEALEKLVDLGVARVLTKGQANSFEEGEELLLALRERAAGRLELLVPGVRPGNVARIVGDDGFRELHFGRMRELVDQSNSARPEVYFGAATKGREHVYEGFDPVYFREIRELAIAAAKA